MRELLSYLVQATVKGDADRLKGYPIGVDVFERGETFDPATDSIVRVQVGRLRKLLQHYYLTEGADDPIRVVLPKGSYGVEFSANTASPEQLSEAHEDASPLPKGIEDASSNKSLWADFVLSPRGLILLFLAFVVCAAGALWLASGDRRSAGNKVQETQTDTSAISLAVLPFANMSGDATQDQYTDGLTDLLTTELARINNLAVASRNAAFQYRKAADLRRVGKELGVQYLLEGGLQKSGNRLRINVQLVDAKSGVHVWAEKYDRTIEDPFSAQDEIVGAVVTELRAQLYNAAKRSIAGRPAHSKTAWELYMQAIWVPGEAANSLAWEKERVALAQKALKIEPNFGQAHSVLADKLAYLANVDPPSDTDELRTQAAYHARRALELAPGDADAVFNVSIYYWHSGQIDKSVLATKRTLELDPNHLMAQFLSKVVPYTCTAVPPQAIEDLIAFDSALSPDSPARWVTLQWLAILYLNNDDLTRAADAARRGEQIFRTPDTTDRLAAILVRLGNVDAGVKLFNQQHDNWPNLDARHYADVTIKRRCGDAAKAQFLHGLYSDLANAVEARKKTAPQ